jgi:uncharacterized OsmC-like protein
MTKMICTYNGDGLTTLLHGDNKAEIYTDLPADNGGKARYFSPTDLFATSLAACALTIMGKMAENHGQSLEGVRAEVEKEMAENPRRIAKITLALTFPDSVSEADRKKYLHAIQACPVHNSLGKDVIVDVRVNA